MGRATPHAPRPTPHLFPPCLKITPFHPVELTLSRAKWRTHLVPRGAERCLGADGDAVEVVAQPVGFDLVVVGELARGRGIKGNPLYAQASGIPPVSCKP